MILLNFGFKTAIFNPVLNSLNASVIQIFHQQLQLFVIAHRYLRKYKNITFVNIFLISYCHYKLGKPFLMAGGGYFFDHPLYNNIPYWYSNELPNHF